MRRHFGDLGAVISKRKTTQCSYSCARHPEIVDPVFEARRWRGGGTLELMFQDPSPPQSL